MDRVKRNQEFVKRDGLLFCKLMTGLLRLIILSPQAVCIKSETQLTGERRERNRGKRLFWSDERIEETLKYNGRQPQEVHLLSEKWQTPGQAAHRVACPGFYQIRDEELTRSAQIVLEKVEDRELE